jgi:hypothetical protein
MIGSDGIGALSRTSTHVPGERLQDFRALCLAIACCAIGEIARSIEAFYLLLYLEDNLHWSMATSTMWVGVISSGLSFAFVGGFIGDRTLKRKGWVGAGLAIEGIGLLLVATMYAPAVKVGLVLSAVGIMLFQGNILVVVAKFAAAAGVKLEIAFVIVFCAVTVGDTFPFVFSGLLYESGTLYPALALLTIIAGLLWLLMTRHSPVGASPDAALVPSSGRRRMVLLVLAFLAPRAINLVLPRAFNWAEEAESTSGSAGALGKELGNVPAITSMVCLVVVPLIVFLAIRLLHKRDTPVTGIGLVGPGFAATGLAMVILGLGAGDSMLRHQGSFALAHAALSAGNVFIFVGLATLTCTLVSNRWRSTATALFAGVPQTANLMISTWQSWPLALPLFVVGAGVILASGLWHLLVVRGFATDLIVQESSDGRKPAAPTD